jgi:hypothetical protein
MRNRLDEALLPHEGVVIPGSAGEVPPDFAMNQCVSRAKKIGKISAMTGLAGMLFFYSIQKLVSSSYPAGLATASCNSLDDQDTEGLGGLCLTLLCSSLAQDPTSGRVAQFIETAYSAGCSFFDCSDRARTTPAALTAVCNAKKSICGFDFKTKLHQTDVFGVQFGCSKPPVLDALLVFGSLIGASLLTLILLSHLKDFMSRRYAALVLPAQAVGPVEGVVVTSSSTNLPDFYDAPQLQPYSPA